jgi:signal transduction histidine kinase
MEGKKTCSFLCIVLITCLLPCIVSAQDSDHRNRPADSLEQVLATNPPTGTDLMKIYYELSRGCILSDIEKSMDYARKGLSLAEEWNVLDTISDFNGFLGICYDINNQCDSSLFYFNKAMEAVTGMETANNTKGKTYTEKDIDSQKSWIYTNTGNLFNLQGKNHEAIEYYIKAMKIYEKYDKKNQLSIIYSSIGNIHLYLENYGHAETYYVKLDSLAHITGDSSRIAVAKYDFANLYYGKKEYDKALHNAEIAYHYFLSHPEEGINRIPVLNLMALIYLEGFDNDQLAEKYVHEGLILSNKMEVPSTKTLSLRVLSTVHLKRGEWRKAEQTALEALAVNGSDPVDMLALYNILAKAYAMLGNGVKSCEYIDKMKELQSSWSNKNYQSTIRDMEVKYDTEKKEHEIEQQRHVIVRQNLQRRFLLALGAILLLLLATMFSLWRWTMQKKRVAEQQKQLAEQQVKQLEQEKQLVSTQAVLDGETRERARLARDLHDGLGSMLTGVKLNLALFKKGLKLEYADAEQFDKAMNLLDNSVREMRRVAHHLMPDSLSRFGLKPAVSDFCNSLSPSIIFEFFGDETRLDPKLEVVVYRCIHELVNNAMKYANATKIIVQIMQESDRIAFTVYDDGCGFDLPAVTQGTGLQNIRTRIASFGGQININSKTGEGTEMNAELKI